MFPVCAQYASTGSTSSNGLRFTQRQFSGYISSHFCDIARGLFKRHSCWGVQVHHWQASVSTECRCSHCQWHPQVWPRPVSSSTRGAALIGCYSASAVQMCTNVHWCLQSRAPQYMTECCIPLSNITCRQRLRSASYHQLFVPWHRRSMFGHQAFLVAGLTALNLLSDTVHDSTGSFDRFQRDLKPFFSQSTRAYSTQEALRLCAT